MWQKGGEQEEPKPLNSSLRPSPVATLQRPSSAQSLLLKEAERLQRNTGPFPKDVRKLSSPSRLLSKQQRDRYQSWSLSLHPFWQTPSQGGGGLSQDSHWRSMAWTVMRETACVPGLSSLSELVTTLPPRSSSFRGMGQGPCRSPGVGN